MAFSPRFSRRATLMALAAMPIGAAIPWLRTPRAMAAPGDIPLRILFFHAWTGMRQGRWYPTGPGGVGAPTRTSFDLGPLMEPLAPFKDRMILFRNLDMVSQYNDPTGAADAHAQGATHALVADNRAEPALAGNVSIDQFIAQQVNNPTPVTYLPSLEVTGTDWGPSPNIVSYAGPGAPVPYLVDSREIWERLFPAPLGEEDLFAAQRASVYNLVRGEHERLIAQLGREERVKIEQHLDERADLHSRLNISSERAANRPPSTILEPWDTLDYQYNVDPQGKAAIWETTSDVNAQLVAAALHTDTTRVASLSIQQPADALFGYTNGNFGTLDWHDLDHKVSGDNPELTDLQAQTLIDTMQRLYAQKLAEMLQMLSERQEVDGSPLLDHTIVVMVSHIGDGSHRTDDLPWVVIGDGHGFFQTGQYLEFARTEQGGNGANCYGTCGRPHNDLFVSLAQAMGIDIDTFGNPLVCTGPITEMHA